MKITRISTLTKNSKVRLSADLVLNRGKRQHIYFEIDKEFEKFISKSENPFIPVALAIAMSKGEDLEINGQCSRKVTSNIPNIMNILESWNAGFRNVSIHRQSFEKNGTRGAFVGCFFSGGVDSFYTYIKNKQDIDYLLFVHGFDIPARNSEFYRKIEKRIVQISEKENIKLIRVKTNLREVTEKYFYWDMAVEFALASVSLFLSRGFRELYMSCGLSEVGADHRFASPQLIRLWSTEHMYIHHFGCQQDKIGKFKFLSKSKIVMENVRVCWLNKFNQYNCCECEKCFRSMLALYASGLLEKCKSFNKPIDVSKLKNLNVDNSVLPYFIAVLKTLKKKDDRSPIRLALEECINRNLFPDPGQNLVRNLRYLVGIADKKFNSGRLYWYLAKRSYI